LRSRLETTNGKVATALDEGTSNPDRARKILDEFVSDIPKTYWPSDKLPRLIDTLEASEVDGFSLFCAGHLDEYGQWEVLRKRLAELRS
jgi:hypothetical protein